MLIEWEALLLGWGQKSILPGQGPAACSDISLHETVGSLSGARVAQHSLAVRASSMTGRSMQGLDLFPKPGVNIFVPLARSEFKSKFKTVQSFRSLLLSVELSIP